MTVYELVSVVFDYLQDKLLLLVIFCEDTNISLNQRSASLHVIICDDEASDDFFDVLAVLVRQPCLGVYIKKQMLQFICSSLYPL